MKKLFSLAALLFVVCLAFNGVAFGWGAAGGDGSSNTALQETAVFFNNANATISAGAAVILDTAGAGVADNSTVHTLGSYVTWTSSADSVLAVGVAKYASLTQTPIVVVTKGPADVLAADSTDAITSGAAVGTGGFLGGVGGGTNLGIALEAGDGTDNTTTPACIIWVDPTGAD